MAVKMIKKRKLSSFMSDRVENPFGYFTDYTNSN